MLIKKLINSLQHLTTYFLIAALGIGLTGCSTDGSTNVDEGDPSTNDSSVTAIKAVASNDIDGNSTITELVVSGANGETQSVITFKLVGENNLPVSGATVAFALTTNSSEPLENRAKINTTSGVSNSEGLVTVTVNSGIVGEVVSVAAISGEVSTASGSITINLINDTTATAISVVDTNGSPAVTQLVVGGEPGETQSIITFKLVGENNLPVNGADVTFTLDTNTSQEASATINKALGISNADGLVSVTINSGTAGEVVSITAISGAASTVSAPITIIDPVVTAITFGEASLSNLVLSTSTGETGATQSIVKFVLLGEKDQPIAGKTVTFVLNNALGGAALTNPSDVSDAEGRVSTTVESGTVPTIVNVTATIGDLTADSNDISISTGAAVPSQFTLLTTRFNQGPPEVWVVDVIVSDQAGNPVADGTQVSFQAESGVVTAACVIGVDFFQSTTTEAGRCNVSWTNGNPPSDGRIEIFATMSGDEDFSDTNGNYSYDPVIDRLIEPYDAEATETFTDSNNNEYWDEGELYVDNNPSNGDFDVTFTDWNGNGVWDSSDLGEPFLDSNENGTFDLGEYFKDTNEDGVRQESGDGLWTPDIFISKSITIDLNAP